MWTVDNNNKSPGYIQPDKRVKDFTHFSRIEGKEEVKEKKNLNKKKGVKFFKSLFLCVNHRAPHCAPIRESLESISNCFNKLR